MRENDGRKLDHKTLEEIRIRVVRQIEGGARPESMAEALGLNRSTVFGWMARHREGGLEALKARPIPGRPRKLSGVQLRRIYTLIVGNDPRQLSFGFALWTREMVRELIRNEFNVRLSVVSVGRLLRKLGLSPQRPLWRAYQQNPVAVERWKSQEYPAIRAEAAAVGATIYFGDEAGVRTDFHAGTTWAPVGQTPVVRTTGARYSVNLISAVSAQRALLFSTYEGNFESATFINFRKRLMHDTTGPTRSRSSWLLRRSESALHSGLTRPFTYALFSNGHMGVCSCSLGEVRYHQKTAGHDPGSIGKVLEG